MDYRSGPSGKPRDYPSPHERRPGPNLPPHHPHSGIPSPVGYPPHQHPEYRPLSNPGSMMPPVSVPGPPPPASSKRAPSGNANTSYRGPPTSSAAVHDYSPTPRPREMMAHPPPAHGGHQSPVSPVMDPRGVPPRAPPSGSYHYGPPQQHHPSMYPMASPSAHPVPGPPTSAHHGLGHHPPYSHGGSANSTPSPLPLSVASGMHGHGGSSQGPPVSASYSPVCSTHIKNSFSNVFEYDIDHEFIAFHLRRITVDGRPRCRHTRKRKGDI